MKPISDVHEQWPAISALLDEALAFAPQARAGWLASLSGPSAAHRDALRQLLETQAAIESGDFLADLPHIALEPAAAPDELRGGMHVGPYTLIAEIGQGGMSSVWKAERTDGHPRRVVALKLPRIAWGGAFVARALRERDILAALEHPNIARLYDAGLDDAGRPWLAMEYVAGEHIDAWCARRGLPIRDRIALILQVCEAVAHSHANLVIHRDLKPANILVTEGGQVRLLDFGIAKLMANDRTQETAMTQVSGRALTIDFASPEQIRGQSLGTASDVYSLAVVSFLLLAETRPYRLKGASTGELEAAITDVDPPLASAAAASATTSRALKGDLDAVLAKALRKSPADRYPTVEAFAADLRRHRDGLPVLARPQGRWYLARRYVARHRLAVGSLAAVFAALSLGLGAALWQADVATRNATLARRAVESEKAVQELLVETLAVGVTADPAKLREPDGFGQLLQAKFDEFERRYQGHPSDWLDLLEVVSTQLPAYGDYWCSLAVGQRYLSLLERTNADPGRTARAALANARLLHRVDEVRAAIALLERSLRKLPADAAFASVRADMARELDQLKRLPPAQAKAA